MKKTLTILLATLALAFATVTVTGAPASAASRSHHCVTKKEFKKIHRGWSSKRVHRKFDTHGKQTWYDAGYPGKYGWPAQQSREYRACRHPRWSSVSVDYKKKRGVWRVSGKTAYWG